MKKKYYFIVVKKLKYIFISYKSTRWIKFYTKYFEKDLKIKVNE